MNDSLNELTQYAPSAGTLVLENVAGETSRKVEHENDVHAADGTDRTMYAFAPRSGCPDPKQTQVLMVLRDDADQVSAQKLLTDLGLDTLAEQEHFLILFPNPSPRGWNYTDAPDQESDIDYLIRCFGALRGSKLGVNGFNGMIYYLAASEKASALLMTMAARRPLNVPAMMIGPFPQGYEIPSDALHVETAAWVWGNPTAQAYLKKANGVSTEEAVPDAVIFYGRNPNVRLAVSDQPLTAHTLSLAWDRVFSLSRRWQNDTYGTYQKRTSFTGRGFTAHVKDPSLGCNNGFAHTWYEYIPPQLRGTKEKVPLVFYFHGVNCVPLYGAEQSGWHDIADREGFIVVYPAPAICKAWNIFNDPALPSDFDFVMALIQHMHQVVHPIDDSRIYATGFSMGGMMTHALCGAYPEVFAAGAPFNAYDAASFSNPQAMYNGVVKGVDPATLSQDSAQRRMADSKWSTGKYRMPLFQTAGFDDATITLWPAKPGASDLRLQTIQNWKQRNNIPTDPVFDSQTLSGLAADQSFYEDSGERFFHQRWRSADPGSPALLEQLIAKRMPHAIVPVQTEFAWRFLRKFRRASDGSLLMEQEAE